MSPSTALFGSAARGDRDEFSDIDCLVVGESGPELNAETVMLRERGFSCSTYTWNKLGYLSGHGSLFVAHLKQEGIILCDPEGRLRRLLNGYRPRSSYDKLKQDALCLIQLLKVVPEGAEGIGWAFDVLFTAFRTFVVPHLAERGEFRFAHAEMVDTLLVLRPDLEQHRRDFLNLRRAKCIYRRGGNDAAIFTGAALTRAASGLTQLFHRDAAVRSGSVRDCLVQTIAELREPRRRGYLNLRSVERACVALEGSDMRVAELAELRREVSAPAAYAFAAYPGRKGQRRALRVLERAVRSIDLRPALAFVQT